MYKTYALFSVTIIFLLVLVSCFKFDYWRNHPSSQKVWGSKPIYSKDSTIRQIKYTNGKRPVISAGNICVYNNYIFQVDKGSGIHIIDNTIPANADRVGFINLLGCSQVSIKGNYLYSNFLNDLVTLDISKIMNVKEVSRIQNAFPENLSKFEQPIESGYYECPVYDSIVIGWVKDSISIYSCYKN